MPWLEMISNDGVLRSRAGQLHGLLNGIDAKLWNPETDPHLACPYGAATLQRKALNKAAANQHTERPIHAQHE